MWRQPCRPGRCCVIWRLGQGDDRVVRSFGDVRMSWLSGDVMWRHGSIDFWTVSSFGDARLRWFSGDVWRQRKCYCCWLLALRPRNMLVYLTDRSVQTMVRAAITRYKLQSKLSVSSSHIYWHRANQSQRWPMMPGSCQGSHWTANF